MLTHPTWQWHQNCRRKEESQRDLKKIHEYMNINVMHLEINGRPLHKLSLPMVHRENEGLEISEEVHMQEEEGVERSEKVRVQEEEGGPEGFEKVLVQKERRGPERSVKVHVQKEGGGPERCEKVQYKNVMRVDVKVKGSPLHKPTVPVVQREEEGLESAGERGYMNVWN